MSYIGVKYILCFNPIMANENKPNIIIFLIDDAGYADFGFNNCNCDLKTPYIDFLARDGLVFTDAHVSSTVSGPSRAGLITGKNQQSFGFECNPSSLDCGLDLKEITLANEMKKANYKTALFGKWHLGIKPQFRPNMRGFDFFYGFLSGGRNYFFNKNYDCTENENALRLNGKPVSFKGYLTDELSNKCIEFIEKNKKENFFIIWAPNAVHTPMEAKDEDLLLFKDHPRKKLAAMTWALDRAIGKIILKLQKENLYNNTLIFFLSDNGGSPENDSSNFPLKGFKGNEFEGGHRVPFIVSWPSKIRYPFKFSRLTSSLDIFPTCLDAVDKLKTYNIQLDGVSLIPFLQETEKGSPHNRLYWRKDFTFSMRHDNMKLIKVKDLGCRLYNLNADLGEKNDLSQEERNILNGMIHDLEIWSDLMIKPLWTEDTKWNDVTWLIHRDLFNNKQITVKNPDELEN